MLIALCAAVPVLWVQMQCRAAPDDPSRALAPVSVNTSKFQSQIEGAYRRPLSNSYLSYPQWYIVHAYQDYAGVLAAHDEAAFDYSGSVLGYWASVCELTRFASRLSEAGSGSNTTLYLIGVSFSLQMIARGAYEETLGRFTAWWRGAQKTDEDRFALATARDYAKFLQQRPSYEFAFFGTLRRFWVETPFTGGNWVRKVERRVVLSIGLAARGVYATGVGWFAGMAPADERIRSVVRGFHPGDPEADPRIKAIAALPDGRTVIETPRHREFTGIVRTLIGRGREFTEIAGNDRVLITVLMPEGRFADSPVAVQLFTHPLQSRPGWRRVGLDASIPALGFTMAAILGAGGEFEHLYDY